VRLLIVDDQTLIRDGLVTICERLPDVEVVGTAGDGEQALGMVAELAPDVVLMDLRMPRMDGIEATRRIRAEHPRTQVVVLTTFSDDESVTGALAAGALGYLTKDAGRDGIRGAAEGAARGQALPGPAVHSRLIELASLHAAGAADGVLPDGLTVREAEVLAHVARGLSNSEIAATLYLSEATVKTHVARILMKTGSHDRTQAVVLAYQTGLVIPNQG